jgi:hypothetical protein
MCFLLIFEGKKISVENKKILKFINKILQKIKKSKKKKNKFFPQLK